MEYNVKLKDERLSHVIAEGTANSTGVEAILFRFGGLTLPDRIAFLEKLVYQGQAEHIVKPGSVGLYAYSIAVWDEEKLKVVNPRWSTRF
ncbi:hypothetical protein SEA_OLGASCLOVER_81 [Gordonia phage OlgasClover]|nr:hypothetical protein SEA_OLGASCLOVER_81 [Gordonia phage OlgasClover]